MKILYSIFITSFLLLQTSDNIKNPFPISPKPEKDLYYKKTYVDSFRYLENLEDTTVLNWMHDQEKYRKKIIKRVRNRRKIYDRLAGKTQNLILTSYLNISENGWHFYYKNTANPGVYLRKRINAEEELLFSAAKYDTISDKKYIVDFIKPSNDGSKLVISLNHGDKPVSEIIIMDVQSKQIESQKIDHFSPAIGGISWLPDNSGFTYTHLPVIDKNSEKFSLNTSSVLYKIGDNPNRRKVLLSKAQNPKLGFSPEDFAITTFDKGNSEYILGFKGGATYYKDYYYSKIDAGGMPKKWKLLFKAEDKVKQFHCAGDDIYFLTAKNSPNMKICKTSFPKPNFDNPEIIISEKSNQIITEFEVTSDGLFIVKTKNGVEAKLYQFYDGVEKELKIPKKSGCINLMSQGYNYNSLWIEIQGWTNYTERYRYNSKNNAFAEEELFPILKFPELDNAIIEEVEVKSHDGEMVPLSLIYLSGIEFNGKNRVFMTGYGGYAISKLPETSMHLYDWVVSGGIYAVAHVRGGAEKGEAWHKGGYKKTKPNTWKDFIACTEFLIEKKYTSPKHIAIYGESAGGILVGRAVTARPDLYSAAIISSGVLNTMRTEFGANGKNIAKELGSIKDSIEIGYLYEMDSYHHIKENVNYPAIYVEAGLNDGRVPIWHSSKFVAQLINYNSSNAPIFFAIDFSGGHGEAADPYRYFYDRMDELSFAHWQTGHPDHQLKNN